MKTVPLSLTVRNSLKLTQGQIAQLLGVHVVTVNKWENWKAEPTPYQLAILLRFNRAAHRERALVKSIPRLMASMGPVAALAVLLNKGV